MNISLTKEETETILLDAINAKFPGMDFNLVNISAGYYRQFCEICKKEPIQVNEQEAA